MRRPTSQQARPCTISHRVKQEKARCGGPSPSSRTIAASPSWRARRGDRPSKTRPRKRSALFSAGSRLVSWIAARAMKLKLPDFIRRGFMAKNSSSSSRARRSQSRA
ncbi:hypothetical protein D9M69_345490 [compost metagenome]